jgi:hypothetical protein
MVHYPNALISAGAHQIIREYSRELDLRIRLVSLTAFAIKLDQQKRRLALNEWLFKELLCGIWVRARIAVLAWKSTAFSTFDTMPPRPKLAQTDFVASQRHLQPQRDAYIFLVGNISHAGTRFDSSLNELKQCGGWVLMACTSLQQFLKESQCPCERFTLITRC